MQKRLFRALFTDSWWVWLFALIAYATYDYATERQERHRTHLVAQVATKRTELAELAETHDYLECRIASQSDPAWMELVLMESLGVVPEGQQKVHFVGGSS